MYRFSAGSACLGMNSAYSNVLFTFLFTFQLFVYILPRSCFFFIVSQLVVSCTKLQPYLPTWGQDMLEIRVCLHFCLHFEI